MMVSTPDLFGEDIHVWHIHLDALSNVAGAFRAFLSDDERARADRFRFERDRMRFALTRGALRLLLGRHLGLAPGRVEFAYGAGGKPEVSSGPSRGLAFNVSHSAGRALIALAHHRALGIDLERERPLPEMDAIAESHFSPAERVALRSLPPSERRAAFFRCWTRKEAFVKATGDGLIHPLDAFDVTLSPGEPARLLAVRDAPAEAARWWLQDIEVPLGFHGALVVEGRPARVECWMWPGPREDFGPREDTARSSADGLPPLPQPSPSGLRPRSR
jgi:4'-phosphopantetheinyl transferase